MSVSLTLRGTDFDFVKKAVPKPLGNDGSLSSQDNVLSVKIISEKMETSLRRTMVNMLFFIYMRIVQWLSL